MTDHGEIVLTLKNLRHIRTLFRLVAQKRCPVAKKGPIQVMTPSARRIVWRWSGGDRLINAAARWQQSVNFFAEIGKNGVWGPIARKR